MGDGKDLAYEKEFIFNNWYEENFNKLRERFILDNPEDFPTDESVVEIENNARFQEYCDKEFMIEKVI